MRLEAMTVSNFRAFCEPTTVRVGDLTAIIGKNDVGKSSLLEALEVFFNNEGVKLEPGDCHVQAREAIIEISCDFVELPESLVLDAQVETALGQEYLLTEEGALRVKKRWKCSTAKPKEEVFVCAMHPNADGYGDLLQLTQTQLRARMRELGVDEDGVNRNSNPAMRAAIWRHCDDLRISAQEISVTKEDGKRIWEKLSAHLPLFALFQSDRSSRDSDSEVQDPMKLAVNMALAEPEVQQHLFEVVEAVRGRALELAQRTQQTLAKLNSELAQELAPEFRADPKWSGLFSLALNTEDGIPLNKRGSGVRRMILVSFFRAEAERRQMEGRCPSIIYAIEEPETSQHPDHQRMLLESFLELSTQPGCQVLLTTHSPGFANYLPVESFRYVEHVRGGGPIVKEGTDEVLSGVVGALGIIPDNRVKVLICVEGPTDVVALKCMSRALNRSDSTIPDLSCDARAAFVVVGGGTLSHWVNEHYLKGLGRPEVHIYDRDVPAYADAVAQVNGRDDASWACLTKKREMENYLHPDAITEGVGCCVAFGDEDDVPALVSDRTRWNAKNCKKKLAARAFPNMTAEMIRERDPDNEVESWLRRLATTMNAQ